MIRFNLIERSFVEIADESANSTKDKRKTLADNEFSATTSRDIIEADNVKQQLFISATEKSQLRIEIVVSSVETITIDVNNVVDYEIFIATEKKN